MGLLGWVAGSRGAGLGAYYRAVGEATASAGRLALYCARVGLYSAVLELALRRGLQAALTRRAGPRPAVALAALAYGLTHLVYHPSGVLYACALGLLTALVWQRTRDTALLALWHVQWNALAVVGSLLLALWSPGAARRELLVGYKISRIEAGLLVWREDLGWLDRNHYERSRIERSVAWAARPEGPLVFRSWVTTFWGRWREVESRYQLAAPAAPAERLGIACRAVLDHSIEMERAQAASPWWGGAQLSAGQPDDLRAVWAACLDVATDRPGLESTLPRAALIERWQREGPEQVEQQVFDLAGVSDPLGLLAAP